MAIETAAITVLVAQKLRQTVYAPLREAAIALPADPKAPPNKQARINKHWKEAGL